MGPKTSLSIGDEYMDLEMRLYTEQGCDKKVVVVSALRQKPQCMRYVGSTRMCAAPILSNKSCLS